MGPVVNVGVIAGVVVLESVQHLARLLTSGSVIEVDQRLTTGRQLIKNRKIRTIS